MTTKGLDASGNIITPFYMVKIHPSSNTLICTEQRGGVLNKYIYINTIANFPIHRKCIAQNRNLSRISLVLPNLLDDVKYHLAT